MEARRLLLTAELIKDAKTVQSLREEAARYNELADKAEAEEKKQTS